MIWPYRRRPKVALRHDWFGIDQAVQCAGCGLTVPDSDPRPLPTTPCPVTK